VADSKPNPPNNTPTDNHMKKHVTIVSAFLGLAAIAFLASSCGMKEVSTHKMGPPGKERTMSDQQMPSQAKR
jgi:hypothetical protein